MPASLNGTAGSVTGYVRDIACPLRNHSKDSAHPSDDVCVRACAKAGAPLGIITPDGMIYNVISHTMPETDERQRLLPRTCDNFGHAEGCIIRGQIPHSPSLNGLVYLGISFPASLRQFYAKRGGSFRFSLDRLVGAFLFVCPGILDKLQPKAP